MAQHSDSAGDDQASEARHVDDDRVARRSAELLPEEQSAGSEDPEAQAEAILEESNVRAADRDAAPDTVLEHRTSDEVTDEVE